MSFYNDFEKYGDRTVAVSAEGLRLSYRELKDLTTELGRFLTGRKMAICFCENRIGSLVGYISCLSNGVVPLLIDAKTDDALVENLIALYQPAYLYMPAALADKYKAFKTVYSHFDFALKVTGFDGYPVFDDLALLLTTSGSTGSPKLVRQSYKNIASNAQAIADYLELDDTERPVTTLPMNYTYGLSIINSHMLVGATILFTTDTIVSKPFWDFMKAQKTTSFGGVPYTYEMLKKIRFFKMKLPDLRTFTQAGGKLSPELHKEFAAYANESGKRFVVMYGQTEATARMAYLPYEKSIEKYGSMGIPIPGGKFRLIDVDHNEITKPDTVGELVYEGDNVTLGYAQCGADLIKGDERNGVLETGDMAKFDADGYYYIVGRKKRFLKLYGNRINLDEIDRLIKAHFSAVDCASTGTDDCMLVYITDGTLTQAVEKLIEEKTHINSRGFKVKTVSEIPRNASGKILYKELD